MQQWLVALFLLGMLGCTAATRSEPELRAIDQSRIPPPQLTLAIPGLGPCTDTIDRSFRLNPQQPVVVLVHGCLGSAGRFRALAEVFAFSGQQAVCFSYNDRDSLMVSSEQLIGSLEDLAGHLESRKLTVIGHSQGGLIARKALVAYRPKALALDADLQLVTISAPFSGIAAASHCGSPLAAFLSLGLTIPICQLASGAKWYEITGASAFIREPGVLVAQVRAHLKINTDETGSCRRGKADGGCEEKDYVFSLEEQQMPKVDGGAAPQNLDVGAGHVEIVGDNRVAPLKLIAALEKHGILQAPRPERSAAFGRLLTRLYGVVPKEETR